jgi:hypothetical protein
MNDAVEMCSGVMAYAGCLISRLQKHTDSMAIS